MCLSPRLARLLFFAGFISFSSTLFADLPSTWTGQWIWSDTAPLSSSNTWQCFKKVVDFSGKTLPATVKLYVAAETNYWLWINGSTVAFEQGLNVHPSTWTTYVEEVSIPSSMFEVGVNTIAALVWYKGGSKGYSQEMRDKGGFFLQFADGIVDASDNPVVTDATWLTRVHPAFEKTQQLFYQDSDYCEYYEESFPADTYSVKWVAWQVGYDEALARANTMAWGQWQTDAPTEGWSSAATNGAPPVSPWGPLELSIIPPWKDYGLSNYSGLYSKPYNSEGSPSALTLPVTITEDTIIYCVVGNGPTGENWQGTQYVDAEATTAGGQPKIRFAMNRYFRSDYYPTSTRATFDSLVWQNSSGRFKDTDFPEKHAVRYYVYVPEGSEVTIHDLQFHRTAYDTEIVGSCEVEHAGHELTTLWNKSRDTALSCMRDIYYDCPDRERAQWMGDVVLQMLAGFYIFDTNANLLTKKAFREFFGTQMDSGGLYTTAPGLWFELPDQNMTAISSLWDYYLYTGDSAFIQELYPYVQKAIQHYASPSKLDANGMLVLSEETEYPPLRYWNWIDWGDRRVDDDAMEEGGFSHTVSNAILIDLFGKAAKLADVAGATDDMTQYLQSRAGMIDKFDEYFRNGTTTLTDQDPNLYLLFKPTTTESYRLNYLNLDDRSSAWAVLVGQVEHPSRREAIRVHLSSPGYYNASPYMEKYVIEALLQLDDTPGALSRLQTRFSSMTANWSTTLWEEFYTSPSGPLYNPTLFGSNNHAWSGWPAYLMGAYVLGVRPTAPGWSEFVFEPRTGALTSIDARVPTVDGYIDATVVYTPSPTAPEYRMTLSYSGEGISGIVCIPQYLFPQNLVASDIDAQKGSGSTVRISSYGVHVSEHAYSTDLTYLGTDLYYKRWRVNTPGYWTFTVTLSPPTVPLHSRITYPYPGTRVSTHAVLVQWEGSEDQRFPQGLLYYDLSFKAGDGNWQLWETDFPVEHPPEKLFVFSEHGIQEGTTVYFRSRAKDYFGGYELYHEVPDTFVFYYPDDVTPPPLFDTIAPAATVSEPRPEFSWNASLDEGIGTAFYEVQLSADNFSTQLLHSGHAETFDRMPATPSFGWTRYGGAWHFDGGMLHQTQTGMIYGQKEENFIYQSAVSTNVIVLAKVILSSSAYDNPADARVGIFAHNDGDGRHRNKWACVVHGGNQFDLQLLDEYVAWKTPAHQLDAGYIEYDRPYWLKMRVDNRFVSGKIWKASQKPGEDVSVTYEPAAYQVEAEFSAASQGAQSVGLYAGDYAASFDDVLITDLAGTLLYQDSFDGLTTWDRSGGSWWLQNGSVVGTGAGTEGLLQTPEQSWEDYTVSCTVNIRAYAAGVIYRNQGAERRYLAQLVAAVNPDGSPQENGNSLRVHRSNPVSGGWDLESIQTYPLQHTVLMPQSRHTLQIVLEGNTHTFIIDGTEEAVWIDSESTSLSGGIGFRQSAEETAAFDNVVVTDAASAVLFEDRFTYPETVGWARPSRQIGSWQVIDGMVSGTGTGGEGILMLEVPQIGTDYSVECRFNIQAYAAGFIYRAWDENNCYMVQVTTHSSNAHLRIHKRVMGTWSLLDDRAMSHAVNTWTNYRLRIELDGATHKYQVYVGDDPTAMYTHTWTDTVPPMYSFGRIGFRLSWTDTDKSTETARFENIVMHAAHVKVPGTVTTYVPTEDLEIADYQWRVRAVDWAGNISSWADGSFSVPSYSVSASGVSGQETMTVSGLPAPLSVNAVPVSVDAALAMQGELQDQNLLRVSGFYDLEPAVAFAEPVMVVFEYRQDEVDAAGVLESTLRLYRYAGDVLTDLTPQSLDMESNTITAWLSNTSLYAVAGRKPDAAVRLDGESGYIILSSTRGLDINNMNADGLTVELFVKPAVVSTASVTLVRRFSFEESGYNIWMWNNKVRVWSWPAGGFESDYQLPAGQWTHLAVQFSVSSTTARLFINGQEDTTISQNIPGMPGTCSEPLCMGGEWVDTNLNGTIDEVRISSCVRYTTSFNVPAQPFEPDAWTAGLWHFDEFAGTTSADASIYGNTAVLHNGITWVRGRFNEQYNSAPHAPTGLLCDGAADPVGVSVLTPTLAWTFSDPDPGDVQSAYQIQVSSSQAQLEGGTGGMWDTGKTVSASATAEYAGGALRYGATYYWRVRTWDSMNSTGAWSSTARFVMRSQPTDYALEFDGVDDYVDLGGAGALNLSTATASGVTVELWVNRARAGVGIGEALFCRLGTNGYMVYIEDDQAHLLTNNGTGPYWTSYSGTPVSSGVWHHLAFATDGTTTYIFVDGQMQPLTGAPLPMPYTADTTANIGRYQDGGNTGDYFKGMLDELRISTWVRYTANFTPATQPHSGIGVAGLWHFDEGTGMQTYDASVHSTTGTLMNGPMWSAGVFDTGGGGGGFAAMRLNTQYSQPPGPDPTFKLREAYAFPNPARGGKQPILHIACGLADSVQVKIYNIAAQLLKTDEMAGTQAIVVDGNYAYEYPLTISEYPSGVYVYQLVATKAGEEPIRIVKKFAVIR